MDLVKCRWLSKLITQLSYGGSITIVVSVEWVESAQLHPATAQLLCGIVHKPTHIGTHLQRNASYKLCRLAQDSTAGLDVRILWET